MNQAKTLLLGALAAVLLFVAGRVTAPGCDDGLSVTLGRDSVLSAILDSANMWRGVAMTYRAQRENARAERDTFEAHIEPTDQLRNNLRHAIHDAGLSAAVDTLRRRAD